MLQKLEMLARNETLLLFMNLVFAEIAITAVIASVVQLPSAELILATNMTEVLLIFEG